MPIYIRCDPRPPSRVFPVKGLTLLVRGEVVHLKSQVGRLILNCSGGLGNQMFEYAAGLYFATQLNRQLEVVQPLPQHAQWNGYSRPFQLSHFVIRSKIRETEF